MRDEMKIGDGVLFYHSNAKPPGVAGIGEVCREAYPDFTAWDPESTYYDPKSMPDRPVWFMVDVAFVEKFDRFISLQDLRDEAGLEDLLVVRKGMRFSVQPVKSKHFKQIVKMGKGSIC